MTAPTLRVMRLPAKTNPEPNRCDIDPLTVFFEDFDPGQGQVTIVCWGRAWSHYWNAMGPECTAESFFLKASPDYLVGKLMLERGLILKRHEARETRWLRDIIVYIKEGIRQGAVS